MGPLGREAYSQEQDGGRDATSLRVRTLGLSGHGGRQGRPDDSSTGEPVRLPTKQMKARKKQLMAQPAELVADGG